MSVQVKNTCVMLKRKEGEKKSKDIFHPLYGRGWRSGSRWPTTLLSGELSKKLRWPLHCKNNCYPSSSMKDTNRDAIWFNCAGRPEEQKRVRAIRVTWSSSRAQGGEGHRGDVGERANGALAPTVCRHGGAKSGSLAASKSSMADENWDGRGLEIEQCQSYSSGFGLRIISEFLHHVRNIHAKATR